MNFFRIEMGKQMKEYRKLLHLTQENMMEMFIVSINQYGGLEREIIGLSLENPGKVSKIFA